MWLTLTFREELYAHVSLHTCLAITDVTPIYFNQIRCYMLTCCRWDPFDHNHKVLLQVNPAVGQSNPWIWKRKAIQSKGKRLSAWWELGIFSAHTDGWSLWFILFTAIWTPPEIQLSLNLHTMMDMRRASQWTATLLPQQLELDYLRRLLRSQQDLTTITEEEEVVVVEGANLLSAGKCCK